MELISIIMPCYNMEHYLYKSVSSVLQQSYPCWELLIIDDGSCDSSPSIRQLAKQDARIKPIFLEQNSGIANARNAGIRSAQGTFIAFLDSDDLWKPTKLEKQLAFMQTYGIDFSYCSFVRVREDGTYIDTKKAPRQLNYQELLKKNHIGCLTVMLNRSHLPQMEMPQIKHEDYATWLFLLREYHLTAYGIQEPLASYVVRNGSVSRNKFRSLLWIYQIYTRQEKLPPVVSVLFLLRWFLRSI